jgi:hypothetical protein
MNSTAELSFQCEYSSYQKRDTSAKSGYITREKLRKQLFDMCDTSPRIGRTEKLQERRASRLAHWCQQAQA